VGHRAPSRIQTFDRRHVESIETRNLAQNWRAAVNNQNKNRQENVFDSDPSQDEGELINSRRTPDFANSPLSAFVFW